MMDEFAVYGLPRWSVYLVGGIKVGAGLALLLGLYLPSLVLPAALLVIGLMIGALVMHLKIRDAVVKSVPAVVMLILSATLAWLSFG